MTPVDISARSYLTAGASLAAATALAFAPLAMPPHHPTVPVPHVTVPELRLAVSPADIEAFVADLQAALDNATTTVADVAGIPGQNLIGVVDNIVTLIDDVFTGLIDATANQTLVASLTILKTLSVDAFAKLSENLGLINPVITTTAAQVGELLTTALTGSLQNMLVAAVNVVNDPLSPASYAGLLTAGVASGQLLVGNGLRAVQAVGDGLFDIAGIALSEVTFQLNNAAGGISELLTQLGEASDNTIVEAVLGAVRGLVIAPAVAVFNLGSGVAGAVLTTAHAGFDVLLESATSIVDPTRSDSAVPEEVPLTAATAEVVTAEASTGPSDDAATLGPDASSEAQAATSQTLEDPVDPADRVDPVVDPVVEETEAEDVLEENAAEDAAAVEEDAAAAADKVTEEEVAEDQATDAEPDVSADDETASKTSTPDSRRDTEATADGGVDD